MHCKAKYKIDSQFPLSEDTIAISINFSVYRSEVTGFWGVKEND